MQGRKVLVFAAMLVPCVILAIAAGCKREYPTRPITLPTFTPTPTSGFSSTFTITATKTRTSTPSPTQTYQFSPTVTNTPTITLTPTLTLTMTSTFTLTPTLTPTDTPTVVPPVAIDDFEDGDTTINNVAVLGITDANTWFVKSDSACTPNFNVVTPYAGNNSLHCGELTGSGCATFGSMGFYFSQSITTPYGAPTYNVAGHSTGVRFDIVKAGGDIASVRFEYMDDYSTIAPGSNCSANCPPGYGQDLTISSTWTAVTIFWSECTLPSWYLAKGSTSTPDPTGMYGMHWIVNTTSTKSFDVQLDNVELINNLPPPTPTPNCGKIDDMEDGNNRGIVYAVGDCGSTSAVGHSGYWYTYQDTYGGTIWPPSAEVNFMSQPGADGSSYAARFTGTMSPAGSGDIFAGMGLSLYDPANIAFYDLTMGGKYSGIVFEGKAGTVATVIRFKIPDVDTDPNGGVCNTGTNSKCYDDFGAAVTLTSGWATYQYSFSSLTAVGFGYPAKDDPTIPFKPAQTSAIQWQTEEGGVDYDFWIDNVTLY